MISLCVCYLLIRLLYNKAVLIDFVHIVQTPIHHDLQLLKKQLLECAQIKRIQGDLALESQIKNTNNIFLKKSLQLMIDRFELADIKEMMIMI